MAATSVGQIGLDLVVNSNQFNKQMAGINSLAKKAGAALAGAFAVKKIVEFGASCVELGSDLAEVQNVVDVTFPHMSAQVDQFAKSAAASFGLSETMAKKFTGTFGAMANAFGFSEQASYEMSSALTGLAGDVASFYNISQDEAYTKLKSVFTGETETLKDLGIVMTQNALDAYAMANGFGKTTQQMSETEKVALRYQFVMQQLSLAQGDFARTSDSWANQTRVLKLQFDSIKATLGQGFINLFTPIIKAINVLLGKLATLANSFKSFTELVTGKKVTSGAASSMNDLAGAAGGASESVGGIGNAATGAGKAAKKAAKDMKALMGFDQVNKLSKETKDSGSGNSGASGGGVPTATGGSEIPKSGGSVQKLGKEYNGLKKAVDNLRGAFGLLAGVVKNAFGWVWENILKPFGKWAITKVAPQVINILAGAFKILSAILLAFKPIWMFIWNNFLKPIAAFTGKVFVAALRAIAIALNGLGDWMLKHQGVVTAFLTAFLSLMAIKKVIGTINAVRVAFLNIGTAMQGAKLVEKIFLFGSELSKAGGITGRVGSAFSGLGSRLMSISAAFRGSTVATIKDTGAKAANALANLHLGKTISGFGTRIKTVGSAMISSALSTIKDTGAKIANAVANSTLGKSVGAATTKIKAMTLAQKAGALASLGIVGAIAGLAIYMGKTGTSADEMAKKIETFADNLAAGITAFADKAPTMLPKIIASFTKVINSLVAAIPKFVPPLIEAGIKLFSSVVNSLGQILPPLLSALQQVVAALTKAIPVLVPPLLQAGLTLFMGLVNSLGQIINPLVSALSSVITALVKAIPILLPAIIKAGITLFMALVNAIPKILPPLLSALPQIIGAIVQAIPILAPALIQAGVTLFMALVQAIPKIIPPLIAAVPTIIKALGAALVKVGGALVAAFGKLFLQAAAKIKEVFAPIADWFKEKYNAIKNIFASVAAWFAEKFKAAYEAVKNAFSAIGTWFKEKYNAVKNVFLSIGNWFGEKFRSAYAAVKNAFASIGTWFKEKYNAIKNVFANIKNWFGDKFKAAWEAVKSPFKAVGSFFSGIWKTISSKFKSIGTKIGDSIGGAFKSAINAVLRTVEKGINWVPKTINKALGLINDLPGVSIPYMPTISLPRLAQGGYVKANTPQLAMIGDNRHQGEVVAPEDKLRQMAMDAVKAAGVSGSITKADLKELLDNMTMVLVATLESIGIYVDSEEVAKLADKGRRTINRRYSPVGE